MADRIIDVRGAAQHNLQEVDVSIGPGLTAVVGVSGSGKSSLAFDTVYHEARRRFAETLALGSHVGRLRPATVHSVTGLGPAVSVAQNVLNRNPNSTVATALGVHPFFRLLFSKLADVACSDCRTPVRMLTDDERVAIASELDGPVEVPLVRGVRGSHARLLGHLAKLGRDAIRVDGRPWSGRKLAADKPHDISVISGALPKGATAARVRDELANADAFGGTEVVISGRTLLRAPTCPGCGAWVPPLPAKAFRPEADVETSSHTIAGLTLADVLAGTASATLALLADAELGVSAKRVVHEIRRRLDPVMALGLDHLSLDRSMPTLSRGEAQRVRLAVVVAGRLEDLLHVLDEPSIGLHRRDMKHLFDVLAKLPGPVVMVEHDAAAVAAADDVIEIGPRAGNDGGRLVFQGTPGKLWASDTTSGLLMSGRTPAVTRERRVVDADSIHVTGASIRNLDSVDCRFPLGALTAVTGPSGAGKTTLVRDVLVASLQAGDPTGCTAISVDGGTTPRVLVVDQSPLGNNPRSNPATYTKVFDRIRALFAAATGESVSLYTFNREDGACPECEGMGSIELTLRYLPSTWVECEACEGARYRPEVLAHRPRIGEVELSIGGALQLSVAAAREVFGFDKSAARTLDALLAVGLDYLELGQPSPTLSGGEAQRVRLARELARAKSGDVIVLDEPTTGLHPADLGKLVGVLDRLTGAGATVIVIEHQPDLIAAADWIIELGPGGGPLGGRLQHCGPPRRDRSRPPSPRRQARRIARASDAVRIRGASANNLRAIDVDIPKAQITAVTGVSGSGKSSLVGDVIESEAMRRLLESMSMYERQGVREGPEAPVTSITGLGPTLVLDADLSWASGYSEGIGTRLATVGTATDVSRLVGIMLARGGERSCVECGGSMQRLSPRPEARWRCEKCGHDGAPIEPRHLMGHSAIAACPRCVGLGAIRVGEVDRLIVDPDKPICGGAMYSPGYFPKGYLCSDGTGGHATLRALAERHGFDPATTLWKDMSPEAQHAFLWGERKPMEVRFKKFDWPGARWRGVMTELSAWDQGGLYTRGETCPVCEGQRLRPEYLSMRIGDRHRTDLHALPITELRAVIDAVAFDDEVAEESRTAALEKARFLDRVGLGHVHLDRRTATLSAGEAQRVKLAAVLGSGLLGMTVLLDEPSRGLHPREVEALATALEELRDAGNTVIAVEHDGVLLDRADHIIEIGPGSGSNGGRVMYAGPRAAAKGATADAIAGLRVAGRPRRAPADFMEVRGARANNLQVDVLRIPLGVLTGFCGVSGSGKSTLVIDTLALALAPPKLTTSVAAAQYRPGPHDAIAGAPSRTVVADQARQGISSPGNALNLMTALRRAFADSDSAVAAGLTESDFTAGCDACRDGQVVEPMGFLPPVTHACDVCDGTGYRAEVRGVVARGRTLPDIEARSLEQLAHEWGDVPAIGRACRAAERLGLGYLVVKQAGWALSGGEVQRLKLARELAKTTNKPSLYLLDEPTVGLHVRDVSVLAASLHEVVDDGHSVVVVEHDPNLLAACDWLIELGPGAGPHGGRIIAEGTPETLGRCDTPTAPYLRKALA